MWYIEFVQLLFNYGEKCNAVLKHFCWGTKVWLQNDFWFIIDQKVVGSFFEGVLDIYIAHFFMCKAGKRNVDAMKMEFLQESEKGQIFY